MTTEYQTRMIIIADAMVINIGKEAAIHAALERANQLAFESNNYFKRFQWIFIYNYIRLGRIPNMDRWE